MTANNWLIRVLQPDGSTVRAAYSHEAATVDYQVIPGSASTQAATFAAVERITWRVTPEENSIRATITGGGASGPLSIRPRDIVSIYTLGTRAGENSARYYPRFTGAAISSVSSNDTEGGAREFTLVGLKDLLKATSLDVNEHYASGQDIKTIIDDVLSNADLPANMDAQTHQVTASLATTTGDVNPGPGSLYEFFDFMASLGQVSGNDVVWGVDPYQRVFLQAKSTASDTVTEGGGVAVEWAAVDASGHINEVRWAIADGIARTGLFSNTEISAGTPDTLTYLSSSGSSTYGVATRTLTPPSAADTDVIPGLKPIASADVTYGLTTGTLSSSYDGEATDSPATLDRISDGNPDSYASISSDTTVVRVRVTVSNINRESIAAISARFTLEPTSADDLGIGIIQGVIAGANSPFVVPHAFYGRVNRGTTNSSVSSRPVPSGIIERVVVFGDRARNVTTGAAQTNDGFDFLIDNTDEFTVGIEDLRLWVVDQDALDSAAELEYRDIEPDECIVRSYGAELSPIRTVATLTLASGATVSNLDVQELKTVISGEDGLVSAYVIGEDEPVGARELRSKVEQRDATAAYRAARARRSR